MSSRDREVPGIGLLRYIENNESYEVGITMSQATIQITISPDEDESLDGILDRVRHVVGSIEMYNEKAKQCAAEHLLELKNESWLDDDEAPLTPVQFKDRVVLKSIAIASEGDLSFYYADDDIFWGHDIEVWLDQNDGCAGANI